MKINKYIIIALINALFFIACDSCDVKNANFVNKNKNSSENNKPEISKRISYLPDSERQKDVPDGLKDNFKFDQFKDVKWDDSNTFGEVGIYAYSDDLQAITDDLEIPDLGVTKEHYKIVNISPDGSCFMRASFHAALFRAFNDEAIFNEMIKNIKESAEKYKVQLGFTQRFRHNDLITLLKTLKKMPAKDRLLNLNKEKVDTFLNYTFRSLFSARNPSAKTNLIVENKWGSAREVLFDFQEMLIPNHNLVLFFPQEGELKQFYVKTPGNKVRFNKKYTENFVDLYDKDINSQSLVADIKKAQKEINNASNELKAVVAEKHKDIFVLNNNLSVIKDIELFKAQGATKLSDFYKLEEMSIIPYRTQPGNHVQLMVRNDALKDFGIELQSASNKINIEKTYLPDNERQKDIIDPGLKDNFRFDQFKDVKWDDPNTFGATGSYATKTNIPMPKNIEMPIFGITGDNYQIVNIKGDGSCFMRASFHAILYKVFSNEEIFNEFINNIIVAAEKYKDIPGFSGRFRHEDLITLLNTLKNLSPKERMKELNKDKVDKFLDYTFRSLLSAHSFKVHNFDEYSDKELLKDNSFGDMNSTMNVISHILLPTQNIISTYTQYENSNIIKNTLNIDSANRKIHYRLDTKTDLSKIYDNEKFKFFAESQGFTTLTSFSTHKDTAVLPYRTGGAHVQLIVRKDSLEQFGIE